MWWWRCCGEDGDGDGDGSNLGGRFGDAEGGEYETEDGDDEYEDKHGVINNDDDDDVHSHVTLTE